MEPVAREGGVSASAGECAAWQRGPVPGSVTGLDREQIKRDASDPFLDDKAAGLAAHCHDLLAALEQAELHIATLVDCDCVPCSVSSAACQKCGRKAIITVEQAEARLAKEPALVEALRRIKYEEGYGQNPAPVIVARVKTYAHEALADYEGE